MHASDLLHMLRSSVSKCAQESIGECFSEATAAEKSHRWKCESPVHVFSSKKPLQGRLWKGCDTLPAVIPRALQRTYCICSNEDNIGISSCTEKKNFLFVSRQFFVENILVPKVKGNWFLPDAFFPLLQAVLCLIWCYRVLLFGWEKKDTAPCGWSPAFSRKWECREVCSVDYVK